MAATNSTTNLGLPQWEATDKPERTDFNTAMSDIDTNLNLVQSGGLAGAFASMPFVGTAPIVESGSNANGNWIKFADGTLVQYSPTITMTKVSNYYLQGVWSLPIAFHNTAYFSTAIPFGDGTTPVGRMVNTTNTTVTSTFYYQNISAPFTGGTYNFNFRAFAIGRWKA